MSLMVPLQDFLDGMLLKCDVYVIGSYERLYYEAYTQERLVGYVRSGKGILVVGPDVMPSIFYAPLQRRRLDDTMNLYNDHQQEQQKQSKAANRQLTAAGVVEAGKRWQIAAHEPQVTSGMPSNTSRRQSGSVNCTPTTAARRSLQLTTDANTLPVSVKYRARYSVNARISHFTRGNVNVEIGWRPF